MMPNRMSQNGQRGYYPTQAGQGGRLSGQNYGKPMMDDGRREFGEGEFIPMTPVGGQSYYAPSPSPYAGGERRYSGQRQTPYQEKYQQSPQERYHQPSQLPMGRASQFLENLTRGKPPAGARGFFEPPAQEISMKVEENRRKYEAKQQQQRKEERTPLMDQTAVKREVKQVKKSDAPVDEKGWILQYLDPAQMVETCSKQTDVRVGVIVSKLFSLFKSGQEWVGEIDIDLMEPHLVLESLKKSDDNDEGKRMYTQWLKKSKENLEKELQEKEVGGLVQNPLPSIAGKTEDQLKIVKYKDGTPAVSTMQQLASLYYVGEGHPSKLMTRERIIEEEMKSGLSRDRAVKQLDERNGTNGNMMNLMDSLHVAERLHGNAETEAKVFVCKRTLETKMVVVPKDIEGAQYVEQLKQYKVPAAAVQEKGEEKEEEQEENKTLHYPRNEMPSHTATFRVEKANGSRTVGYNKERKEVVLDDGNSPQVVHPNRHAMYACTFLSSVTGKTDWNADNVENGLTTKFIGSVDDNNLTDQGFEDKTIEELYEEKAVESPTVDAILKILKEEEKITDVKSRYYQPGQLTHICRYPSDMVKRYKSRCRGTLCTGVNILIGTCFWYQANGKCKKGRSCEFVHYTRKVENAGSEPTLKEMVKENPEGQDETIPVADATEWEERAERFSILTRENGAMKSANWMKRNINDQVDSNYANNIVAAVVDDSLTAEEVSRAAERATEARDTAKSKVTDEVAQAAANAQRQKRGRE